MTSFVLRNYSDFGHSRFLPVQCLQSYLLFTRAIRHGKSQSSSLRLKNVKKNEHNEDQTVDNVVVKSSPPLPISPNPPLQKSKLQNQSLNQLQWQLKHISRTRNRESLTLTQEDYPVPQIGTVILRNGTVTWWLIICSNVLFQSKIVNSHAPPNAGWFEWFGSRNDSTLYKRNERNWKGWSILRGQGVTWSLARLSLQCI